MRVKILKRSQAERDIEESFVYIAEGNPDIGISFLAAVENSLQQIAEFPFIGKERRFENVLFQSIRMWHVKDFENYLIFYIVTEEAIEIIRVIYHSRDIYDLFS